MENLIKIIFLKLKDLLLRSINAWCDLLKPENHLNVPVIRMELTFDDQKMQFYPSVITIRDLLFSIVDKLATALPNVSINMYIFINNNNHSNKLFLNSRFNQ